MTRDEGVEICIEALNAREDGSDEYFKLMDDLKNLKKVDKEDEA